MTRDEAERRRWDFFNSLLRAKLILEVWGRIVLKYIRVRTSGINPKIPCLRRSE